MSSAYEYGRRKAAEQAGVEYRPRQAALGPLPEAQQKSGMQKAFDEPSDIIKTPLKGLGWLLDVGNKYVTRPALGATMQAADPILNSKAAAPLVERYLQATGALHNKMPGPAEWVLNNPNPLMMALGPMARDYVDAVYTGNDSEEQRQAIADADSFTKQWHTRMQGSGTTHMVTEAILDPLNLVGVGLLGKGAKGIGLGAKAVSRVQAADDLLNSAQSLPITLPMKGIRAGLNKTPIKAALEKSKGNKFRTGKRDFQEVMDLFDRNGLDYGMDSSGSLADLTPDIVISAFDRVDDIQPIIRNTDHSVLGRVYDEFLNTGDERALDIADELMGRGMMTYADDGFHKTKRLIAHEQIDEISDVLQHGADERQAFKDSVDITANRMFKSNPDKFKTIDDAYDFLQMSTDLDDAPVPTDALFQTVKERMKGNPISTVYGPDDDLVNEAIEHFQADVPELIRRGAAIEEILSDNRSAHWYQTLGKSIVRLGFRDDVPAFSDDVIDRLLTTTDPQYDVVARQINTNKKGDVTGLGPRPAEEGVINRGRTAKGVMADVNPIIDSAHRTGVTMVRNVDPERAASLGIDLAKYQDPAVTGSVPPFLPEGSAFADTTDPMNKFLDDADARILVADNMRGISQRRFFAHLWGAGGTNTSPRQNTGIAMSWFEQMVNQGSLPEGLTLAADSFDMARRAAAGAGDLAALNNDFYDTLWLSPDFRYPGRGPMLITGQTAADITARETPDQLVQFHGMKDKIHNYTEAAYEYANMWEAYDRLLKTTGDAAAAEEFLNQGLRNVPGVVLDRHMWRMYGSQDPARIGTKGKLTENTAKGLPDAADSPEEWMAAKVLSQVIFEQSRDHPVLSKVWRNAHDAQATLWYASFLNQDKGGTGFGLAGAMARVFGDRVKGDAIQPGEAEEVIRLANESWQDTGRLTEQIEKTAVEFGNTMPDFVGLPVPKTAYETLLRSGRIRPDPDSIDEISQWLRMEPGAIDEILGSVEGLTQTLDDIVKGTFVIDGKTGRANISFKPEAGMSTAIHELMGHGMRHGAGPADQASIRRGVGEPVYRGFTDPNNPSAETYGLDVDRNAARMGTEAEETFARMAEADVQNRVPSDPTERDAYARMRRLTELEYIRNQGLDVPDRDFTDLLTLDPERVDVDYRVMARAKKGTATPKDIRRIATSGQYGVVSPRTTEAVDDPALAQKMNIIESRARAMGYEPYRAEGMYGGEAEPSIFIPDLSRDDAIKLGQEFGQESVMMGREGQVYVDGSKVVRNADSPVEFNASENFTRVFTDKGEVTFSQPLDFADDAGVTDADRAFEQVRQNTQFSAPRQEAGPQEVLDQIGLEAGLDSETVRQVSDRVAARIQPMFDANPQLQAVQMWQTPRAKQHLQDAMRAGDEDTFNAAVEAAAFEIDGLWSSLGTAHPAYRFFKKFLAPDLRKSVEKPSEAFGRRRSGSILSEDQIRIWREATDLEGVKKAQDVWQRNVDSIADIVNTISKEHALAEEFTDMTTIRDLRRIREFGNARQQELIDKFFKTFDLPNIEADEAMNLTMRKMQGKNLMEAHQKALAKELGIDYNKTPEGLGKLLAQGRRAWREQALLSVRYHMANAMDMTVKSMIYGVNPIVAPGSAQKFTATLGRELPQGVRIENASGGLLSGMGAEAQDVADDAGVLTKVPGIGRVFRGSNSLARGIENSIREAAFRQGAVDNLQRNMPAFEAMIRRELGPEQAELVINDIRKTMHGVSFSSEKLSDTILTAGGDARAASRIANTWDRSIDSAYEEGRELSNLVHFDFGDERVIEDKLQLRKWAPFHFWATRNIPFYLDTLAANPIIMRVWQDYNNAAGEEHEANNLPDRLKGMVPLPGPADKVLDFLFGPGRSYFNPMVVLSLADQTKPRFEDQDTPLLGRTLDKLQTVGLAPAPWFSYPLSALGVYGADDEQMPLLRHSSMLKNATGLAGIDPQGTGGIDVEQPLRAVTNKAREVATGKKVQTVSGSAYKDYQISKVLAEMSLELTGQANHPEILAAMRDPDSVLYREAEKRVQKEGLLTDLQHFTTPVPHKRITEVEQGVRNRQADLPEGAMADRDFRNALVESGDPAGAYLRTPKPKVLEPVYQDQYGNVQGNNQSSGGSSSGVSDQLTWGGNIWGPDKPPPFNNPDTYRRYVRMVATHGYIPPEQFATL